MHITAGSSGVHLCSAITLSRGITDYIMLLWAILYSMSLLKSSSLLWMAGLAMLVTRFQGSGTSTAGASIIYKAIACDAG